VPALRLYYVVVYLGLGAIYPLMAILLGGRGLRPSTYAWLMAMLPLSRVLAPPLWGALADKRLGTVRLLRINSATAGLAVAGLAFADALPFTALAFAVWAAASSSLVPLVDASTYRVLGAAMHRFSRVRVFGSIGFALSAAAVSVIAPSERSRGPLWFASACYLAASVVAFGLPEGEARAKASVRRAVRAMGRDPRIVKLWIGSVLYYAAHAVFDVYFGPFARALPGVTTGTIGLCWSLGVLAEIGVMWGMPRFLDGERAGRWLVLAALVAAGRWALTSQVTSTTGLYLLAPLHGITFGLWFLAFAHENQRAVEGELRATAQGVGSACLGLGTITSTLVGGMAVERVGGRVLFGAASLLALAATAVYAARLRAPASR
jgi:MFS transporter, PPP family, 3-phenylpropionic acid transporter